MATLLKISDLYEISGDQNQGYPNYSNPSFEGESTNSGLESNIPLTFMRKTDSDFKTSNIDAPNQGNFTNTRKWNILKNLIFISLGFFFLFTAFQALSNLQSSLNPSKGLGTTSLSVIYGALVLSCMFVPSIMIKKLGCKWTLVLMPLLYATYIGANFKAGWWSLIPTALLVGFAAAPLWSAKCTYLSQIGTEYAELIGEKSEVIIVRFFGLFFMIFQSGQIVGNLISSLVLNEGGNTTISSQRLEKCGAVYCNEDLDLLNNINKTNNTQISDERMYKVTMLCGIYLACAFIASLLIMIFVDQLKRSADSNNDHKLNSIQLLVATFYHLRNPKQILIIPLTMYSGIEQAFFTSDFTKAFITCPLGIDKVGYVVICYGCLDAVCSPLLGPTVKKIGRIPLYLLGTLINIAVSVTLLKWQPNLEVSGETPFYMLSALWGMADAIWQTQINAFYGVIFTNNEEAAFSNYRLWESLGFILAFAYSNVLCINQKLYILLAFLCSGILGYLMIEFLIWKQSQKVQKRKSFAYLKSKKEKKVHRIVKIG